MNELFLTVMFATRNGSATLRKTLEGYRRLNHSKNWRMVIIDNGSTDDTVDILNFYKEVLPLQVYNEERPGKNLALNAGLNREEGHKADLYVFTDDDAVPMPGFLDGWLQVAKEQPSYDIFGGLVIPEFMDKPPAWLFDSEEHFGVLFAKNDRPEGKIKATHVYGPNMAVRSWILKKGYKFDEDIGPSNKVNYAMGSETEFCVRIESKENLKTWFTHKTAVQHLVRKKQTTVKFFSGRAFRHGRGYALQQLKSDRPVGQRKMIIFSAFFTYPIFLHYILTRGKNKYNVLWKYHWQRGYLLQQVESTYPSYLNSSAPVKIGLSLLLAMRAAFISKGISKYNK